LLIYSRLYINKQELILIKFAVNLRNTGSTPLINNKQQCDD
jgi:hypothetical protein